MSDKLKPCPMCGAEDAQKLFTALKHAEYALGVIDIQKPGGLYYRKFENVVNTGLMKARAALKKWGEVMGKMDMNYLKQVAQEEKQPPSAGTYSIDSQAQVLAELLYKICSESGLCPFENPVECCPAGDALCKEITAQHFIDYAARKVQEAKDAAAARTGIPIPREGA